MIMLNSPVKPDLNKLRKYLEQVNESGWYTNFGPLHQQLTAKLEEYLGVENLLLVSNGTVAIQVACKALKVESALTTPFSFVATTSSLLWQNIDVAFCDIEKNSLNLSPEAIQSALQQNNSYDAIIATHVYGNPCDVSRIGQIANQYQKKVIYDAAHAFGVKVDNKSVLNFGDASTLSFHATKIFHTIEGGAIVFKNKCDYENAKKLISFGMNDDGIIEDVGINAKLNEYQCAVGLTILDSIDKILEHRCYLFNTYLKELSGVVNFPIWNSKANINGSYMPVIFENDVKRKKVEEALDLNNIQFRAYFSPLLNEVFSLPNMYCNPENIKNTKLILCLPLHYNMNVKDVLYISSVIRRTLC
ncbi:DegT/DnrJ/EryC1/StrS family aminotransferase [Vibrio lentus]|uniref:DegT/DnrJ/EryC1/StrS aminotransferase family protein n=1 Tax=Vibrio lentus TaxID=136468 RepID=UPI000C83165F|nr:DegT/DnrJ/EryC1/StrS family aminotransferase [Vibrio lentus]PMM56251.1 aminotransferase DegT [Vibrio lentus]